MKIVKRYVGYIEKEIELTEEQENKIREWIDNKLQEHKDDFFCSFRGGSYKEQALEAYNNIFDTEDSFSRIIDGQEVTFELDDIYL
jgi:hypothetical protein